IVRDERGLRRHRFGGPQRCSHVVDQRGSALRRRGAGGERQSKHRDQQSLTHFGLLRASWTANWNAGAHCSSIRAYPQIAPPSAQVAAKSPTTTKPIWLRSSAESQDHTAPCRCSLSPSRPRISTV